MNFFPNNPTNSGKMALIVIGMHRSGTSATTGALRCLGIELGRKLYTGHSNINAKGYFEHSDIADTNEEVLLSLGSAWDDILLKHNGWWTQDQLKPFAAKICHYISRDFSRSVLWAVKDPRICRLLPWWSKILAGQGITPHFLFVIRAPDAVCHSLARRDGFSRDKSLLLWLLHYLEAERDSRGYPRAFMTFDRFLEDPIGELTRVEGDLDLHFPKSPPVAEHCLKQFLSVDLRHHRRGNEQQQLTPIATLAYELEAQLENAASAERSETIDTDGIAQELASLLGQFQPLLVEQLQSVGTQRGQVELTVNRTMRSWSWVLGKPVRHLERLLRRDV